MWLMHPSSLPTVRLSLYCGNVIIEGRYSDTEKLYDAEQASMDGETCFRSSRRPIADHAFFP